MTPPSEHPAEVRREGRETRPGLPGGVEIQLGDWSQEVDGGRADDAILYLTDRSGKRCFGTLTLGWFREHTTFDLWERAIISNRAEDAEESDA